MVAQVMYEDAFYSSLKDNAASLMMVFLFAINISSDIELIGVVIPLVQKRRKALRRSRQIHPLAASPHLTIL